MKRDLIAALLPISDHEPVRRNLDRANLLLSSLQKFWRGADPLKVFIVVPDSQYERIKDSIIIDTEAKNVLVILQAESDVSEVIASAADKLGPAKQMAIKMLAPQILNTDFALILDSDLVLCKPLSEADLIIGNRAITDYQIPTMHSWFLRSAAVLGIKPDQYDLNHPRMFVTPQILSSDIIESLQKFLVSKFSSADWIGRLFDVYEAGVNQWTEYTLYDLHAEREDLFNKFHLPEGVGEPLHCFQQSIWEPGDLEKWEPLKAFNGQSPGYFMVLQSILAHDIDFDVVWPRVVAEIDGGLAYRFKAGGDTDLAAPPPTGDSLSDIHRQNPASNCVKRMQIFNALSLLTPYEIDVPKVRIGPQRDGAYILAGIMKPCQPVVSFGIGTVYTFDEEVAQRGHDVYMFDHTIGMLNLSNKKMHFYPHGVGPNDIPEQNIFSIKTYLDRHAPQAQDIILKMDVEGAEWDVLEHIDDDTLQRFSQVTMEVHDLDRLDNDYFRRRFVKVMRKLNENFTIFHVHGNNYVDLKIISGFPICPVLELSFVRTSLVHRTASRTYYPSSLDLPNLEIKPDHLLWFYPFAPILSHDNMAAHAYRNSALPQLPGIAD
ncbi:hypothetical protein LPLAFNJD_LOCUS1775 [Methylorubrum aminovorans]